MSNRCEFCGKATLMGNNVSHAHNKTRRPFHPNLQVVRTVVNGQTKRVKVCTRCIRTGLVTKPVKTRHSEKVESV